MPNTIENLGKGAIPDSPDGRDYRLPVVMGAAVLDWTIPFMLPEPPSNDQNGSSSCVGQGWSNYHWQLRDQDFSRRDIYAQIVLPGGGANIRDGGLRIVNYGQELRTDLPDPVPETEAGMTDRTGINLAKEKINQELNSFVIPKDIDSVAAALKNYKGVVFGLMGSNPGWQDMANPRPPTSNEVVWGHCLYLFGFHLHDGLKCVIAKSSWGNSGNTTVHHIKENYFATGDIFNPWTLIPKDQQNMTNAKLVQINKPDGTKEFGYYLPATGESSLIDKGLNLDYPLPTLNNGSNVDWPNVKPDYII